RSRWNLADGRILLVVAAHLMLVHHRINRTAGQILKRQVGHDGIGFLKPCDVAGIEWEERMAVACRYSCLGPEEPLRSRGPDSTTTCICSTPAMGDNLRISGSHDSAPRSRAHP